MNEEKQQLTQNLSIIYNEQIEETYQCRICLEEETNLELLISPCRCSGTSKYVHRECLRRWRYQDINAPGFSKCMECNEEYIILNSNDIESENIFIIFNKSLKLLYFQMIISLPISFVMFVIDYEDESIIKSMPGWNSTYALEAMDYDSTYKDLFYLNLSIYIENQIFLVIYLLRVSIYVSNIKELLYLMRKHFIVNFFYYNLYWLFTLGMGISNIYQFAIVSVFLYQLFSYKMNYLFLKYHNKCIENINSKLNTGVASMDNNPLNIIIDDEYDAENDEYDTDDDYQEGENDGIELLRN